MLFLCLRTKTYLSSQLLVYLTIYVPVHDPAGLPVHFHTFIQINRYDIPVNVSTVLHVHRRTCSSVYLFSLFFGITCTMTFQLIYWGTYTQIHPKVNLPAYLHASLSSNHKCLPVTTTTCVPAHICTRSWSYLFIFILSFRLTV